jgi:hypothetical protein
MPPPRTLARSHNQHYQSESLASRLLSPSPYPDLLVDMALECAPPTISLVPVYAASQDAALEHEFNPLPIPKSTPCLIDTSSELDISGGPNVLNGTTQQRRTLQLQADFNTFVLNSKHFAGFDRHQTPSLTPPLHLHKLIEQLERNTFSDSGTKEVTDSKGGSIPFFDECE